MPRKTSSSMGRKKRTTPRRNFSSFNRFPRGCRLCKEKIDTVDYKDVALLQKFITEQGKIIPGRISGNCAFHQRRVAKAIRQARIMALLPFIGD
jgi:small subunit ribosomal protein S18